MLADDAVALTFDSLTAADQPDGIMNKYGTSFALYYLNDPLRV